MCIQKSLPGLYPKEGIAEKAPESEKKVYEALKEGIPKGWYAWHSMKLRTSDNGFTETDFVIADPEKGILILEVKGGIMSKKEGHWYQNEDILSMSSLDSLRYVHVVQGAGTVSCCGDGFEVCEGQAGDEDEYCADQGGG